MELIITEKPSVAKAISRALNIPDNSNMHPGYIEGGGYIISWCVGHLVELATPEKYDAYLKKWSINTLPIEPNPFKYEVKKDTKKQFNILKALIQRSDVANLIEATDSGREGELIFRLVYMKAGCKKPFKRLWISSMEESAIRDGFKNLKPGSDYDALFKSAISRQKADWIVGINGTRLFTTLYNKLLKVGRVQSPTLSMIVTRDMEIEFFKKEAFYTVHLTKDTLDAVSEKFTQKEEAAKIALACKDKPALVKSVSREEKSIPTPKLYDLTSLQRDANRIFGMSAKQTLDCTQNLYEKKLCTYPRTDSMYITKDMKEKTEEVIRKVRPLLYENNQSFSPMTSRIINDAKVTDHHAIIPTIEVDETAMKSLSSNEEKILNLIITRLIAATSIPYKYKSTKAIILCENTEFIAQGTEIVDEGFRTYEKVLKNRYKIKSKDSDADKILPLLRQGEEIKGHIIKLTEGFTKPPLFFTEDTLLKAMEHAGCDEMDDEVERKGLGTPATRADIIEKLVKDGFVRREKKKLISTDKGRKLVTILPENIKSPLLTAEWENALLNVAKGTMTDTDFMKGITKMVEEMVTGYEAVKDENPFESDDSIGTCPKCGGPVFYGKYGAYCSSRCGMTLAKAFRHQFTKEEITSILKGEKTLVNGLMSKKNTPFSAYLIPNGLAEYKFQKEDGSWFNGMQFKFEFEFPERK